MDPRINILPHQPGVYIMRDKSGVIIYVGKAKNLSDRVKQYFQESNLYSRGWKLPSLLPLIAKIDYVTCDSERDALVLEEKLIKEYQPFFNSLGKDGNDTVSYHVTVDDIKNKIVPALDDNFAKDMGFDTLDALKAKVKESLDAQAKQTAQRDEVAQIEDHLVKMNNFALPQSLVEEYTDISRTRAHD